MISLMSTKPKSRTSVCNETIRAGEVVIRAMSPGDAITARRPQSFVEYGLTILQFNVLRMLHVQDENPEAIPAGSPGEMRSYLSGPVERPVGEVAAHVRNFCGKSHTGVSTRNHDAFA